MSDPNIFEELMSQALEQGRIAAGLGEVPVGAVVAKVDGEIVSRGHNLVESRSDPSAHAEVLALQQAGAKLGNWRLQDLILCVTLEPCTMCCGALRLARIGTVVFGVEDLRAGACGSIYDLSQNEELGPSPRVIRGIREAECKALLQKFFADQRRTT